MERTSFLDRLRAKPEHIRKRYSFLGAFGITAVIFAFWLGSFSAFGNTTQNSVSMVMSRATPPAQSLVASVSTIANTLKDMIFGAKKVTYSSVEVLPGKK